MKLGPKGYEATLARFQELSARLEALRPRPAPRPVPSVRPSPSRPLAGGFVPLDPFSATSVSPDRHGLAAVVRQAAASAGVDPALFEALVEAESGFDPAAVSPAGAQGLSQLMPGTAKALGVADPFDPAQNADGGARYLAQMLREFGGDERLALAAYNAGPGAVRRHGGVPPFAETRAYVERVLAGAARRRGG